MKVLEKIKKIFLTILGVAFFGFALIMTLLLLNYNQFGVTQFGSTSLIIINDEISSDEFKKGDLVLVKSKRLDRIKLGDMIFTYRVDSKGTPHVDLGKVGEIYTDENAISFENGATYSIEYIAGEASKIYGGIGTFLSIVESKWGFLFMILVPGFLVFIYELYALIVEIKYGKDE